MRLRGYLWCQTSDLAKGRTTSEAQNRMPCIKKVLKIRLFSDTMKKVEGSAHKEAGYEEGISDGHEDWIVPYGGATLLGCPFGVDTSSIIKVHDDPQGGLVGVHVAPQAPLRVFCNV